MQVVLVVEVVDDVKVEIVVDENELVAGVQVVLAAVVVEIKGEIVVDENELVVVV